MVFTVLKLNDHFKRCHPPLKCDKCDSSFHTPSSLVRHSYTHLEPHFKCKDCDKQCYFKGELKQHHTVHLKTRLHACNYGNCQKWFMNKPDLLKHIQTHTAEAIKCDSCEYQTKDISLYKNHIKLHLLDLLFVCDLCHKKFKHRNQLRHHKLDKRLCQKRSLSPEY